MSVNCQRQFVHTLQFSLSKIVNLPKMTKCREININTNMDWHCKNDIRWFKIYKIITKAFCALIIEVKMTILHFK